MLKKIGLFLLLSATPAFADMTYQETPLPGKDATRIEVSAGGRRLAVCELDVQGNVLQVRDSDADGIAQDFYADGALRGELPFKHGTLEGYARQYHPNGRLARETEYRQGKVSGYRRTFWPNGQMAAEERFRDGQKQGWQKSYNVRGELLAKTYCRAGRKDGVQVTYFENGYPASRSLYAGDQLLGKTEYDEQGRITVQEGEIVPDPWTPWEDQLPTAEVQGLTAPGLGATADERPDPGWGGWWGGAPQEGKALQPLKGTWVLAVNLTQDHYAMQDLNSIISTWNDFLDYYGEAPMENVTGGSDLNFAIAYWFHDRFFAGLDGGFLTARASGGSGDLGVEYELSALEYGFSVNVAADSRPHLFSFGIGLYSVGLVNATEYQSLHRAGYYDGYRTFSGSCLGVKITAGYQAKLGELGLGVDLGYRFADISNVRWTASEYHDEIYRGVDDEPVGLDFSGFFLKGGLRMYVK